MQVSAESGLRHHCRGCVRGIREACNPKTVTKWQGKTLRRGEGTKPGKGNLLKQMIMDQYESCK